MNFEAVLMKERARVIPNLLQKDNYKTSFLHICLFILGGLQNHASSSHAFLNQIKNWKFCVILNVLRNHFRGIFIRLKSALSVY